MEYNLRCKIMELVWNADLHVATSLRLSDPWSTTACHQRVIFGQPLRYWAAAGGSHGDCSEQGELWRRLRARDWSGKGLALLPRRSAVSLRGRAEGTPVAYERPCNGSFLGIAVAHVRPGGSSNSLQRSSECVNDCLRNILDTLIFFFCKPRLTPGKYCLRPIMQGLRNTDPRLCRT
nr:uncharacterized protein LOC113808584 [Penaeus vannamei]